MEKIIRTTTKWSIQGVADLLHPGQGGHKEVFDLLDEMEEQELEKREEKDVTKPRMEG